jgi:hypothetical protein
MNHDLMAVYAASEIVELADAVPGTAVGKGRPGTTGARRILPR